MAKLPDPLSRRHLVESPLDPAKARALADLYLEQGRSVEAVAFLRKAEATEGLEALRAEAVETGDVFLLREVSTALGSDIDARTWATVAESAAAAGREAYADEARRQAAALGAS